jgi:hypothetical protein
MKRVFEELRDLRGSRYVFGKQILDEVEHGMDRMRDRQFVRLVLREKPRSFNRLPKEILEILRKHGLGEGDLEFGWAAGDRTLVTIWGKNRR